MVLIKYFIIRTHRICIGKPTCDAGWWSAPLIVDETDTVFFDHGLDHLPGMLILHGIAELAELASGVDCATGRFDLEFTRYVEKDTPAVVSVAPLGEGDPCRWQVKLAQADRIVCSGTVGTIGIQSGRLAGDSTIDTEPDAEIDTELADAVLVHRHRPENVVVTALRKAEAGFAVDYAPSEAVRTKRFETVHCPLDVVEATRQFMTLMCHEVCGLELDRKLILGRLGISMPQAFPRTGAVRLFAMEPVVSRNRLEFTITARCGEAVEAVMTWDILAVSPTVYTRLRGVQHA